MQCVEFDGIYSHMRRKSFYVSRRLLAHRGLAFPQDYSEINIMQEMLLAGSLLFFDPNFNLRLRYWFVHFIAFVRFGIGV